MPFIDLTCRIYHVYITVCCHPISLCMKTCLMGTLQWLWMCICALDVDYFKNMRTVVQPLISTVMWILKDNLTHKPLRCNSICTVLKLDSSLCTNSFPSGFSIDLRHAVTVSPTWFIIFSTRYDCNNYNVPYELFLMLAPI